jgi:osmoprotectant transport system substrate-binding protein
MMEKVNNRRHAYMPGARVGGTTAALLAVTALSFGLAACGSSGPSSSSSSASQASGGQPEAGKPAVTIGDENFPEENILGQLYAQALKAKGYTINLKSEVGSSKVIYNAMQSGQIDMYPEYTGVFLSAVAKQTKLPTSAADAYKRAKAFAESRGLLMLDYTPFYDSDALAVLPSYATEHKLASVADLKPLGKSATLGGAPEFATRSAGVLGLKKEYGLNLAFTPIARELSYKALESGQVDVQDVFTTDGQLLGGKFKVLADPKHVFGFENVAPIIKDRTVLLVEGPAFEETVNKVSKLLTIAAVQQMNKAVSVEKQSPASVATRFLKANGLV